MTSATTGQGRAASLVATCDQWVSATHANTAVDGDCGELTLTWDDAPLVEPPEGETCIARGVATDRLCRMYRLHEHHIERLLVGPTAEGVDYSALPDPVVIVGAAPDQESTPVAAGPDFAAPEAAVIGDGTGIAIDADDRLYLSDRATKTVAIMDLWSHRLLRTVSTATPINPDRYPMGLASTGSMIFAAVREPAGLLTLSAGRGPQEHDLPAGVAELAAGAEPSRVAVLDDGTPVMLFHDPAGDGWLLAGHRSPINVGATSDIVVDTHGAVVLAPCSAADGGATLRRLVPNATGWTRSSPLNAQGYDGSGLVLSQDGRIGYFSAAGFRLAVIGAVTYATDGHCVTYRFDSGIPLNRWGRLFLEACSPEGTKLFVGAATSDDEFQTQIAHVAAEPAACVVAAPAATPPLPPESLVLAEERSARVVHRRGAPQTPWWTPTPHFETYEAPVIASPGRYLWVTVRLHGNSRRTPRVRELRVERQAHTLMKRLPAVFSADEERADFLHRYLASFDGMLHDLELRSRCRDILVDPCGTPTEALDWLASFFGLCLDGRWAEAAQRQLIAEIVPLYRRRGTLWSISRYIEIFLAGDRATDPNHAWVTPILVEHFRLRGLGGPLLGSDPTVSSRSVLGQGFRVGGSVGDLDGSPLDPADDASSPFTSRAHRFTVLIPQSLGAEEDGAIRHILDTERPAHTAYDLCTVDAGMRVGTGLHVGLSSIIGATGAFDSAITDLSLLGRGSILGGPTTGIAVEAGRIGTNTRVG